MKKRILSGILSLALMVALLPSSLYTTTAYAAPIDDITGVTNGGSVDINGGSSQQGGMTINKTAKPTGNPNEYEITLTIMGQDIVIENPGNAEIVLVFDYSGSMNATRMKNAKEAALTLFNGLNASGLSLDVALVPFAASVYPSTTTGTNSKWAVVEFQDISTAAGLAALTTRVGTITAGGGTATDLGFAAAYNMFVDASGTVNTTKDKYVILITDGEPNSVAKTTTQADKLKSLPGMTIYTIGCEITSSTVKKNMRSWATNDANGVARYYDAAPSSALAGILKDICDDIVNKVEGGAVTDPIPLGVNPATKPDGTLDCILVNGGSVSYAGGVISWNPGDITTTVNGTLVGSSITYKVTIDPTQITGAGSDNTAMIDLNGKTEISYQNPDGSTGTAEFIVPKGQASFTTIHRVGYLTNSSGQYLNANGQVVANASDAHVVFPKEGVNNPAGTNNQWGYGSYVIDRPVVSGYTRVGSATQTVVTSESNRTPVLEVTYTSSRSISYNPNGGGWSGSTTTRPHTVNVGDNYPTESNPTREGYIFDGWTVGGNTVTLPSGKVKVSDTDVVYTAKWKAAQVNYTVEHYLQNPTGGTYPGTPKVSFQLTGTTATNVNLSDPQVRYSYPGYTYHHANPDPATILANGSLVVRLYYTANTNTSFKVEHYWQNGDDNNFTLHEVTNHTGTTGAAIVVGAGLSGTVAKTYAGYTLDLNASGTTPVANRVVNGDGSTVIKLYYTANVVNYKVEHYLQNPDGVTYGAAFRVDNLTAKVGKTLNPATLQDAAAFPGYTYDPTKTASANVSFVVAPSGTVIKIYYTANSNVRYVVEHYRQNGDGSTYPGTASESVTYNNGVPGAAIVVGAGLTGTVAKTYPGYTLDLAAPNTTAPALRFVKGDGTTVIRLYYRANTNTAYRVEHYQESLTGTFVRVTADDQNLTGITGATATWTPKTTAQYPGFTYAKTKTETENSGVKIAGDGSTVIKVYYTRNTNTAFKVEHYWQNGTGVGYTLHETVPHTGKTGAAIVVGAGLAGTVAKTYVGYTLDLTVSGTTPVANRVVNGDGTTVIKLYYTANSVTYKVEYYLQNGNGSWPTTPVKTDVNQPAITGQVINPATVAATLPANLAAGYTYSAAKTSVENSSFAVAGNNSTVIKIYYTANTNTAYTVQHYQESLTTPGVFVHVTADDENLTGTTGATATWTAKTTAQYPGFTYAKTKTETENSGVTIAGNGSTIVKVYYTRNGNTAYRVEHYLETPNAPGTYTFREGVNYNNGRTGATIEINDVKIAYAGYTLITGAPTTALADRVINGNGTTVIKLYYSADTVAYTVEHYLQNPSGAYTLKDTENKTGKTDTVLQTNTFVRTTYTGYTYSHTVPTTTATIAANGQMVIKIYYDANTNVQYVVNHYLQNGDGTWPISPSFPAVTYNNGTTGKTILLDNVRRNDAGYTMLSTTPTTDEAGRVVKGDGSTVINIYYTANTVGYTVEYYLQDGQNLGNYNIDPSRTNTSLTGRSGAVAPFPTPVITGYTYNATKTVAENGTPRVKGDGSLVIKVYYDAANVSYRVEHYRQNGDGSWPSTPNDVDAPNPTALTGSLAPYTVRSAPTFAAYEGYTFKDVTPANPVVAADGSLVIRLRYEAANVGYTVEHYVEDPSATGGYALRDTVPYSGITGQEINLAGKDKVYTGFTYDASLTRPVGTIKVQGDGSTVIKMYYTVAGDTHYVVRHHLESGDSPNTFTVVESVDFYTGRVGYAPVANAKTYVGYTFDATYSNAQNAGKVVQANGSTVIDLYYRANTNTPYYVEHYVMQANGSYPATPTDRETLYGRTGETVTPNAKTTYTGFAIDTSKTTPTSITGSWTIAADGTLRIKYYYAPAATTYTIEHYVQQRVGGYALMDTTTHAGVSYQVAHYLPYLKSYPGFVNEPLFTNPYDENYRRVKPDGSLVIKVYYVAASNASYSVEYYFEDVNTGQFVLDPSLTEVNTNRTVYSPASFSTHPFHGYVYDSTLTQPAGAERYVKPDNSTVIKLYYRAIGGVEYLVEHYLEDPNSPGTYLSTPELVEHMNVKPGLIVTAVPHAFAGYTLQPTLTTPTGQLVATVSPKLVIKMYYSADTVNYTIEHYRQNPDGSFTLSATQIEQGRTGTQVTPAIYGPHIKSYVGYTHNDALTQPAVGQRQIKGDGSTVIKLYYVNSTGVAYTVNYYLLDSSGMPGAAVRTENLTGTTGAAPTYPIPAYAGYTLDRTEWLPTGTPHLIRADGTLVINLYYRPNNNTRYVIEHYLEDNNGTFPATPTDVNGYYGKTGDPVTITPRTYYGYAYDPALTTPPTATIAADGSTVIKVYYVRKLLHYTVNYYLEQPNGTYTLSDSDTSGVGLYGSQATITTTANPVQKVYPGYVYDSTFRDPSNWTITGDHTLTINLRYKRDANVSYTVEHYYELSGGGYNTTPDVTETQTGTMGDTVIPTPLTILPAGLVYRSDLTTPSPAIITASPNLVLKLYYMRSTAASYRVEHLLEDPNSLGTYTLDAVDLLSGKPGDNSASAPRVYAGYTAGTPNMSLPTAILADNSLVIQYHYDVDPSQTVVITVTTNYLDDGIVTPFKTEITSRSVWAGAPYLDLTETDVDYAAAIVLRPDTQYYVKSQPVFPYRAVDGEVIEIVFAAKVLSTGDLNIEHMYHHEFYMDGILYNQYDDQYNENRDIAGTTMNVNDLTLRYYGGRDYDILNSVVVTRIEKELVVPLTQAERDALNARLVSIEPEIQAAQGQVDGRTALAHNAAADQAAAQAALDAILLTLPDFTALENVVTSLEAQETAAQADLAAANAARAGFQAQIDQYYTDLANHTNDPITYPTPPAVPGGYADIAAAQDDVNGVAGPLTDAVNAAASALTGVQTQLTVARGNLSAAQATYATEIASANYYRGIIAEKQTLLDNVDIAQQALDLLLAEKVEVQNKLAGNVGGPNPGATPQPVSVASNGDFAVVDGYTYTVTIRRTNIGNGTQQPQTPPVTPPSTTPPPGYTIIGDGETPLGNLPNTSAGKSVAGIGLFALLTGAIARFRKKEQNSEETSGE
ncbi:VWA domain-containing protein [Ruminococcaceae bacterium OttesenSCG-928-N02]|nr:VWA domain-containing protein [Ruminococcaceae bacterium OttesenSCG-928-N02]